MTRKQATYRPHLPGDKVFTPLNNTLIFYYPQIKPHIHGTPLYDRGSLLHVRFTENHKIVSDGHGPVRAVKIWRRSHGGG